MMQITCDECEKVYRIDENRMKGEKARLKCRACDNIIIVTKQQEQPDTTPKNAVAQTAAVTKSPQQPIVPPDPASGNGDGQRPAAVQAAPAEENPKAESTESDLTPGAARSKVRFGLFPKIVTVMLIISLLPFIIFWAVTYREAINRTRAETEQFFTLTATALGTQVDGWIDNNALVLKSAVDLPAICPFIAIPLSIACAFPFLCTEKPVCRR